MKPVIEPESHFLDDKDNPSVYPGNTLPKSFSKDTWKIIGITYSSPRYAFHLL
jgi:hypothetical protein